MSTEPRDTCKDPAACAGIRTILVPPDIVGVQRRSPLPVKKRTPWRPRPDGEAATERAGGREWFSDQLFVEAQQGHQRSGYGTAITLHVSWAVVVIILLAAHSERTVLVSVEPSRVMPAMLFLAPVASAPGPASRPLERPAPKASVRPPAAAPAPPAGVNMPAPVEAPSEITPETGAESYVSGAVEGGVPGGVAGGTGDGPPSAGSGSPGPLRVGGGIKPPRKIKDVKPVYPQGALSDQSRGTVVIEATIGVDGKVKDAVVLQSVAALDQAALDAVRQWEYTPSLVNGMPVAVIITVIVNFSIQ